MAHSSLRTVRLHQDASRKKTESTASLRPLTLKDMSGLLVFTNLTELTLHVVNGFDLDDQQMKILAETLHHLETLHLSSHYPPIDCPQITFEGLKSVALHCLKLKDLAMTFNA